ncbi:MAG: hypothetical protein PHW53_00440 [Patescibacteria group bacterium]|nr:hypothetical protein [Patescibacteria group bacterium]
MEEILGTVASSTARLRRESECGEADMAINFMKAMLGCAGYLGDPPIEWVADPRSLLSPGFYRFYLRPEEGGRVIVKKSRDIWEIVEWLVASLKSGCYEMLSCPGAPTGRMGDEPCAALDPVTWMWDLNQLACWSLGLRGNVFSSLEGSLFTRDENGPIHLILGGETASILARTGLRFENHCPWMFGLHIVKTLKRAGRFPFIGSMFL